MEGNELQTKARKFHRSTRLPEEPWCTSFETPFDRLAHLTRSLFASVFTSTLSTRQTMQHTWTSDSRVVLCFVLKPVFSVVQSVPTNESGPLSLATKAALHFTSFSLWDHRHNSRHLEWNCFQFLSLCIICGWKYIYDCCKMCSSLEFYSFASQFVEEPLLGFSPETFYRVIHFRCSKFG